MKNRVVVAMSGGVDSSVAAALLEKQGYDVIGIFIKLWSPSAKATGDKAENICCSLEAATAARAVANKLKIPFYVVNFAREFKKAVVDYYVKEYENSRTPNPCVICNRDIKGELLLKKAADFNADYLATGHYVRLKAENQKSEISFESEPEGSSLRVEDRNQKLKEFYLYQGVDKNKDQSYFLWTLTQKQLTKMLFPVGDLTKLEVRALAQKMGLPTAQRKESQGICFIPDRDVCGFLHRYGKKLTEPGKIVDLKGKILGEHFGLINYTIGQRERLGLGGPKAYYVVKLDSKANILIVGDEKDLYSRELIADGLNWISKPDFSSKQIGARIRYGHPIDNCAISQMSGNKIKVKFKKPQRAITPGQSIVFYSQEKVLGGGIII